MIKKSILLPAVMLAMFLVASVPLQAQPPPPSGILEGPVDNGVYILFTVALIYGYFRIKSAEEALVVEKVSQSSNQQ